MTLAQLAHLWHTFDRLTKRGRGYTSLREKKCFIDFHFFTFSLFHDAVTNRPNFRRTQSAQLQERNDRATNGTGLTFCSSPKSLSGLSATHHPPMICVFWSRTSHPALLPHPKPTTAANWRQSFTEALCKNCSPSRRLRLALI